MGSGNHNAGEGGGEPCNGLELKEHCKTFLCIDLIMIA